MTKFSSMRIEGLELPVTLGWESEERNQEQQISLNVLITFKKPPLACATDDLADTACYDSLIKCIKKATQGRSFRLIEHLSSEIYCAIKVLLSKDAMVGIELRKHPPISDFNGYVKFSYGDIS